MKIKNLKCYPVMLGCASLLILSGCGSKRYYLGGTVLDGAFVATVDGEERFLKIYDVHYQDQGKEGLEGHVHYRDIINGETFTDDPHCDKVIVRKVQEITGEKSITGYLTAEDLQKALDDELTVEDLMNALNRKNQSEQSAQKTK